MKALFLFFSIITIIINKEPNSTKISKQYKVSEIIALIEEKNTKGYKIIDPNDYIKKDHEKKLEKQLKEIYKNHKVETFIIIISGANLKDENNKEIDLADYTESILEEIYAKKIVGPKVPIIVSVTSINGKVMSMKTHGSVSYTITQQDCYNILSIINNYFTYGEYSYGAVELGKLINYYLVNTSFFSRNKRFFYMILLLIICFIFCYIMAIIAQKIKDRRNMRLTMSDEEKLLKIRDFLKKTKVNRKILSDSCIICLESFENCISITHTIANQHRKNRVSSLNSDADPEKDTNFNTNLNSHEDKDIQIEMHNIKNKNNDENEINEIKEISNEISNEINEINNENEFNNENNDENEIDSENNNNILNENESNVPRNYDTIDNQISTLPCGHRYHVKCITQWMMQKKNICPMCREKIDVDIPEIDDEDLQNELLNIQIELHPAFALLVFQTINEELTWGAMALPAINGGLFSGLSGFAFI